MLHTAHTCIVYCCGKPKQVEWTFVLSCSRLYFTGNYQPFLLTNVCDSGTMSIITCSLRKLPNTVLLFNVIAIRSSGNGYIKHKAEINPQERKCLKKGTAVENEDRNKGKETRTETKEGGRRENKERKTLKHALNLNWVMCFLPR